MKQIVNELLNRKQDAARRNNWKEVATVNKMLMFNGADRQGKRLK